MNTNQLIWAVVALTLGVVGCISALTIWGDGDSSGVVTKILTVASPTLSILVLLLQVSRKAEEVKKEARLVAEVTAEGLEGARDSARKAKAAHEQTAQAVKQVVEQVAEISGVADTVKELKSMVNGERDKLNQRIAELEQRLKGEVHRG